jgi:hypothetical protein
MTSNLFHSTIQPAPHLREVWIRVCDDWCHWILRIWMIWIEHISGPTVPCRCTIKVLANLASGTRYSSKCNRRCRICPSVGCCKGSSIERRAFYPGWTRFRGTIAHLALKALWDRGSLEWRDFVQDIYDKLEAK